LRLIEAISSQKDVRIVRLLIQRGANADGGYLARDLEVIKLILEQDSGDMDCREAVCHEFKYQSVSKAADDLIINHVRVRDKMGWRQFRKFKIDMKRLAEERDLKID
jgi:hypothetical protein